MKNYYRLPRLLLLALLCLIGLCSCASRGQVRHLASDVSLVVPQQTTMKETLTLLGYPDIKKSLSEGREEWIYYQAYPSLLRRMAWVGKRMGFTDYDLITITFANGVVVDHEYRLFTEEEFKGLGIVNGTE